MTLFEARERLSNELYRLYAGLPILSMNVELGINGQPRSGRPEPADPGAAIYFRLKGRSMVMACDHYTTVAQNVAALAAHIEATRRIERYGVATTEQMFNGFLALPAPLVPDDWRQVLGTCETLEQAEAAFRRKMRFAHPDLGGAAAEAAALNAAIALAREALR